MRSRLDSAVGRPIARRWPRACVVVVFAALAWSGAAPCAQAETETNGTVVARVFEVAPQLDGVLTEWEFDAPDAPVGVIDRRAQALPARAGAWQGPQDLSARFQAGLSTDALYFAFAIEDDAAFHPGEPWWHGDAIELFLDLGFEPGTPRANAYHDGCWQIFVMPRNPDLDWGVAFQGTRLIFDDGGLRGVRVARREREGGCDIELRIPLADLGLTGDAPHAVGFALAVNDSDAGPADPGSYLSWNGLFDLYRKPDNFGTLQLPRAPPPPAAPPARRGVGVLLIALAVGILALAVVLLVGPGGRVIARLRPSHKIIALTATGLLALLFAVDARRTEAGAEAEVTQRLEVLAEAAEAVAEAAASVGALPRGDADARERVLADLLRGRRAPTALPPAPSGVALAELRDGEAAAQANPLGHALYLAKPRALRLPHAVRTRALSLTLEMPPVAERDPDAPTSILLGSVAGEGPDQARTGPQPIVVRPGQAPRQEIRITLPGDGPWDTLHWAPAVGAPPAVLRGISVAAPGGDGTRPLLVAGETDAGIPILGGPECPTTPIAIGSGEEKLLELPYLLGADRLWLVLSAREAFPKTLGEAEAVRLQVLYDDGDPTTFVLRNAEHLVAEVLPPGIGRPTGMASSVAYEWADLRGNRRTHDAVALPLDASRRAISLHVVNEGGAGGIGVVAATVLRRRTPDAASILGSSSGGLDGADDVFVRSPDPLFAAHLGPGSVDTVRVRRVVGPEAIPTLVTLSAPLPIRVEATRTRTRIGILTCLAVGLVILAFLAADAVQSFHRLTLRLAFAVLVAALVPLGATIVLVDRTTYHRLEAEHAERGRVALASAEDAMRDALRETRGAARRLAGHLTQEKDRLDAPRAARLVRLYQGGMLPGGAASQAIISQSDGPTLEVQGHRQATRLRGPRYLAKHSDRSGLYVSPWDGLLLVGSARSGRGEDWVRVALGVRVDDTLLAEQSGTALPDTGATVAVLDGVGTPLAAAGTGGGAFLRALARHREELAGGLAEQSDVVLEKVTAGDDSQSPRLAVVTRLAPATDSGEAPWIAVGLSRAPIESALREQREQLGWLALFGVVLVVGVASLTARRVADPVQDLVRVTEAVRRGEFDVEVPPAGTDEVGNLTVAFDQMRHDLKHRVGDLDFLRRAQTTLAASLDFQRGAASAVELMQEASSADAVVLLDATSAEGPLTVSAEAGRASTFADRAFRAAPGGWIEEALRGADVVEVDAPAADERVAAEGKLGQRIVESRPAWLAVPLNAGGETTGLAVLAYDDPAAVPSGTMRRLLEPLAGVCALALYNARLYRLAALDDVTRLPGATAFEAALRTDVERAAAGGEPVVLLRIGLDHLERTARRQGVERARSLLRACATALRDVAGDISRQGRLREDELAVRLVGISREEAMTLAESIRERLSRIELPAEDGGEPAGTTVTIGIARGPDDATSLEFVLDAAGRALTAARREGGDRVEDAARLDSGLVDLPPFEEGALIRSEKMVRVVEAARRAARADSSVLITGETGTGKEVIANLVHRRSARCERPFVAVNCAAFPETLLESELFGHERGAFTGAERRKEGRFELADGGTLFLDEIAEMAPSAQVKLLRVLQERQFTRLGGTRPVNVDVRIIAATNQDLETSVEEGLLREDLYYRHGGARDTGPGRSRRAPWTSSTATPGPETSASSRTSSSVASCSVMPKRRDPSTCVSTAPARTEAQRRVAPRATT